MLVASSARTYQNWKLFKLLFHS